VVQFGKEASQTRGYCGAQGAPSARYACSGQAKSATRGSPRSLAAQETLARDDNQTTPPRSRTWLSDHVCAIAGWSRAGELLVLSLTLWNERGPAGVGVVISTDQGSRHWF